MKQRKLAKVGCVLVALWATTFAATAEAQNCDAALAAGRDKCAADKKACICKLCPKNAQCGGTEYGCRSGSCSAASGVCNDGVRATWNRCIASKTAGTAPAYTDAIARANQARRFIPGGLQGRVDQVTGAITANQKAGAKMTPGFWARVRDAIMGIVRGPQAFAESMKKLSPTEVLKMEEQKAWTGN